MPLAARYAVRLGVILAVAGVCALPMGCGQALSIFDPAFLADLGVGSRAASLPGAAPAVLVEVENRTTRVIDVSLSWRIERDTVETLFFTIGPDEALGEVLFCPVDEVTLGDVGDLNALGAAVRLGGEGPNDPFVEVEPFGVLLKNGANYDCGDSITFTVQPSSATPSGYQIFALIQRADP